MSLEWIPVRVNLLNDPVVAQVSVTLQQRSSNAPRVTPLTHNAWKRLVVGCIVDLWSIADQNTIDGFLPGYTEEYIDGMSGVTGFAQALSEAGWLVLSPDGARIPLFDRWFGTGGKRRALSARRQRKYKDSRQGHAESGNAKVTHGALPERYHKDKEKEKKRKPGLSGGENLPIPLNTQTREAVS